MNTIKPSPAVQVRMDTPISKCLSLMNEWNIGSVLVYSQEDPTRLVGIFTERDLLRNVDLIRSGDYWSFPVSSIMTRPVVTVTPKYLDRAASLMLDHGFRHLPVVEPLPGGRTKLHGVVSIRDLLRAGIQEMPRPIPAKPPLIPVLIKTQSKDPKFDASMLRLLRKLLSHATVSALTESKDDISQRVFILDADGLPAQKIAALVRTEMGDDKVHAILVLYSAGTIAAPALKALEELRLTHKLELFLKPINLLALSDALGRMRVGR